MLKLYCQNYHCLLSQLVLHVELVLVSAALGHSRALHQKKELCVLPDPRAGQSPSLKNRERETKRGLERKSGRVKRREWGVLAGKIFNQKHHKQNMHIPTWSHKDEI